MFAVLTVFSLYVMREQLLQNAQQLGSSLTKNYAAAEQSQIDTYSTMMELGTEYLDQLTVDQVDEQEIQSWSQDFFHQNGAGAAR